MKKQRPKPEMIDDENPELTAEDFARMRPARDVLPAQLVAVLPTRRRGERGPGRAPKGQQRTVRLWPEVAAAFPSGEGSNDRINEALLAFVQSQKSGVSNAQAEHGKSPRAGSVSRQSAKRSVATTRSGRHVTNKAKGKKVA